MSLRSTDTRRRYGLPRGLRHARRFLGEPANIGPVHRRTRSRSPSRRAEDRSSSKSIRAWAPRGADRFLELVQSGFFNDDRFFRVVPGFVAQFGLNDKPKLNEQWDNKRISDDSVRQTNARGTLVFATEGPNTRAHQLFLNLVDNARLDGLGFAPIGRVVQGMAVVDSLYSGYGDQPNQEMIGSLGNSYLARIYPKLDFIKTATVSASF